jgi:hypothetical protein
VTAYPKVGVGLPIAGPYAGPTAIEEVATAADRLGFHSVTVSERLLLPGGDEWSNDFGLPEYPFYDAIETLTWVAAKTEHVRLRTDVMIPLFQQPVVLARRIATLDHLSGGRAEIGVARGWLPEEFAATGVDARIGDGLTIGFRNWDSSLAQAATYRAAGGTGPIVFRAGPMLADAEHRTPSTAWTEPSVLDDLARAKSEGIDEVLWDLNIVGYEPARQVELLKSLAEQMAEGR